MEFTCERCGKKFEVKKDDPKSAQTFCKDCLTYLQELIKGER